MHGPPFETVIPDVQLRGEPVLSSVLATEAVRVNGWRMRDVVELLVTKLGAVESKERSGLRSVPSVRRLRRT